MPAYIFYESYDNEEIMRFYRQGLTDEELAQRCRLDKQQIYKWRWRRGLPANIKPKPEDDGYAADIKKCLMCEYWRGSIGNARDTHFCHHLLDTGRCRERRGESVPVVYTESYRTVS